MVTSMDTTRAIRAVHSDQRRHALRQRRQMAREMVLIKRGG